VPEEPKDRAARYRANAEQARAIAASVRDETARAILVEVAAAWERLARAEEGRD
jgi:hypothetical protein